MWSVPWAFHLSLYRYAFLLIIPVLCLPGFYNEELSMNIDREIEIIIIKRIQEINVNRHKKTKVKEKKYLGRLMVGKRR